MKRAALFTALLAAFSFSTPETATAQQARLFSPADSVSVGDRFRVAIVVDRPVGSDASYPDPAAGDSTLGDLEILSVERSSRSSPVPGTMMRDSVTYLVTTFTLDTALVPPQEVVLVADGDTSVLLSNPAIIPVRSLVPEGAEDIQDLAPIINFRPNPWPWILLGGIILLGALLGVWLYRRRKNAPQPVPPPPPPIPAYDEAVQRLDRLETMDLQYDGDQKPYYVELSDILRNYIDRRTGFPALESTTRELLRHLEREQMKGFPSTAVARLRMVLERSDFVKFADGRLPPAQGREAAAEARMIVDEVENVLRQSEASATVSEA